MRFLFEMSIFGYKKYKSGCRNTVWFVKAVSYCRQRPSARIETIYLSRQARERAEVLEVAVVWIRKVEFAITRVDSYVVESAELSPIVIVDKHFEHVSEGFKLVRLRKHVSPVVL